MLSKDQIVRAKARGEQIILGVSVEKLLLQIPTEVRYKFANPKYPRPVADFVGTTELEICRHLAGVIVYIEGLKQQGVMYKGKPLAEVDGNLLEPKSWIGLTDEDIIEIRSRMLACGWDLTTVF